MSFRVFVFIVAAGLWHVWGIDSGGVAFAQTESPRTSATGAPAASQNASTAPRDHHIVQPTDSVAHATSSSGATQPLRLETTYAAQVDQYRTFRRTTSTETELMLTGFVIDETLTKLGRDFYSAFYRLWRTPDGAGFHTVRIVESPTPGRGTLVQVFVNDDVTYRTRVQPGSDPLGNHPLQAARRTFAYIQSGNGTLLIR